MPISHQGRGCIALCFLINAATILNTGCGSNQAQQSKPVAGGTAPQSATELDGSTISSQLATTGAIQKSAATPRDRQTELADLAAIEKLEGRVEVEGPERTVVRVDLGRRTVTDADLA